MELNKLVKLSKTSETIFLRLAMRKRNRKLLNLQTFFQLLVNEGADPNSQDFLMTFQELEKEGYGRLLRNEDGVFFQSKGEIRGLGFVALGQRPLPSGERRRPRRTPIRPFETHVISRLNSKQETVQVPKELLTKLMELVKQ